MLVGDLLFEKSSITRMKTLKSFLFEQARPQNTPISFQKLFNLKRTLPFRSPRISLSSKMSLLHLPPVLLYIKKKVSSFQKSVYSKRAITFFTHQNLKRAPWKRPNSKYRFPFLFVKILSQRSLKQLENLKGINKNLTNNLNLMKKLTTNFGQNLD